MCGCSMSSSWSITPNFNKESHPKRMAFFQIVKKASQNFVRKDETKFKSIFRRDMCVTKNTFQPSNVEFVCIMQTNYALQKAARPLR